MNEQVLGVLSALWLGVLTSISPCPLATNVLAISYIAKDVRSRRRVFLSALLYTAGRAVTYVALAGLLLASVFSIPGLSNLLQEHMNRLLGPVLVLTGMVLLGLISLGTFGSKPVAEPLRRRAEKWGLPGAALLGVLFALSFCPVSAALYFGSLVPLALKAHSTLLLPSIYGFGTALPVLVVALVVASSAHLIGLVFNRLSRVESWARVATGLVFVVAGVYLSLVHIFGLSL
jgi:cytochrome c biogenesis protein CcdA